MLLALVTVFLLFHESYLLHLLYSYCSMKVTHFIQCINAALWKLPASVTIFLKLYESYLLQILYSCHDDKDPNAKYTSLEMYKAWHLQNWLLEAYLTVLFLVLYKHSRGMKGRLWLQLYQTVDTKKVEDLLSESFHNPSETWKDPFIYGLQYAMQSFTHLTITSTLVGNLFNQLWLGQNGCHFARVNFNFFKWKCLAVKCNFMKCFQVFNRIWWQYRSTLLE